LARTNIAIEARVHLAASLFKYKFI